MRNVMRCVIAILPKSRHLASNIKLEYLSKKLAAMKHFCIIAAIFQELNFDNYRLRCFGIRGIVQSPPCWCESCKPTGNLQYTRFSYHHRQNKGLQGSVAN
jgi:hypothetical protein